MFQFLVRLLDHNDRSVHHRADGDRHSTEGHDVRGHARHLNWDEGQDDGYGNGDDRDNGTREMPQEDKYHEADNDQFFQQRVFQVFDRPIDQVRAVVRGHDLQSFWQRRFNFRDFFLNSLDDLLRVFAKAHDDNTADGFAFAVDFRNATPDVRAECHGSYIPHQHRCASLRIHHKRNACNVIQRLDVSTSPHHVFTASLLN